MGCGRIVIELRSVNHRFLEIRSRAPRELAAAEPLLDKLIRDNLSRGHCTANLSFESPAGGSSRLDAAALEAHLDTLAAIAAKRGLSLESLVPVLAQAPDLFTPTATGDADVLMVAVTAAFDDAIGKLLAMRIAEGQAMTAELTARLDGLVGSLAELAELAEGYPERCLEKTRARICDLLEGAGMDLDQSRVEAEAALLADRADINEEITRLQSHCDQMAALLDSGEPVGRRLEFLTQEMGREANTIGAKAATSQITHMVVDFKAELEKMRELAQNIE